MRRGQGRAQKGPLIHQDVFLSSPQTLAPGCHPVFIHLLYPDCQQAARTRGTAPAGLTGWPAAHSSYLSQRAPVSHLLFPALTCSHWLKWLLLASAHHLAPHSSPKERDGKHCDVLTSVFFRASWPHLQTEEGLLSGKPSILQETLLSRDVLSEGILLPRGCLEGEGISDCLRD